MGILTNFLKLLKPEPNDFVDVAKHISENYDKLDENAKSNDETLTNLSNDKLDKGTYPGNASDLNTEISKIASTTQLGRIKVGTNLRIDENGFLHGNPDVDISGKMDKYKNAESTVNDYDDLIEDGFYIVGGLTSGVINAPHGDPVLLQVWGLDGSVYQKAVSYYDVHAQFTRCFKIGTKNTKWERIANTATLGFVKIGECLRVDQSVSIYGYDEFVVCELYSPSIMLDIKYFTKKMVNSLKSFKFESYAEVLECEWVFSADGNTITLKNLGAGSDGGIYVYGR